MNTNLFKAILAMDSYNRGYGEGITLPVALNTTKIGNATIISQSDTDATHDPVKKGFYGIAYQLASGEKVIAYRGTDDYNGILDYFTSKDVGSWTLGTGNYRAEQALMALQFYNGVAGNPSDTRTPNISFTGHSLGGGLAGYVVANDNFYQIKSRVA